MRAMWSYVHLRSQIEPTKNFANIFWFRGTATTFAKWSLVFPESQDSQYDRGNETHKSNL